ncbi:MAG: TreTu family toxin [Streptosporangiaceae bacterium]
MSAACVAPEAAGTTADAGGGLTRVGRWMSAGEHQAMTDTRVVQEGAGGVTDVASPADPAAYMQQAASGSRYVEFNVPADSLSPGGKAGWATIRGPNSFWARYGRALPEMPPATDIEWLLTKP